MALVLVLVGLAASVAAAVTILGQASAGTQPWSPELRDNVMLAQAVPFALGLGVAVGMLPRGRAIGLWALFAGLLLGIPTGTFEYLGGLLDVHPPFSLYVVYRLHYVGAVVILFAVAAVATHVWRSGDRSFLVPRGQWRAYLRGLAGELPPIMRRLFVGPLKVDMRTPAPPRGAYSFYEILVSFPWWATAIGLITVTGVVKAIRYSYAVPGPVLFWASTLHVAAMVMIALKVLDQLRIALERDGRLALAGAATAWGLASLAVAYWFLWSAFAAQTAAKEGILSQLALVVGGLGVALLALLVIRRSVLIVTRRTAG